MDLRKMGHSLSPAGCCIVLSLEGFLRVKQGIAWSSFNCVRSTFCQKQITAQCPGRVTLWR